MTQKDWASVKIPALMTKDIDKFLQTDEAKKMRILSRTDFLTRCVNIFLEKYEREYVQRQYI